MLLNTVSSYLLIAKVYRDFGIKHSGWETDAIEWIGDALSIIGHCAGLQSYDKTINVTEYRFKIPCNVESIQRLLYNGTQLRSTAYIGSPQAISSGNYYTRNGVYINTPFEEGCVRLIGKQYPTDENGYPLIPDGQWHKEAISMHVIMKMIMAGYKHPVFDYKMAANLWETYYPRAQNEGVHPNIDNMERFRLMWTNWTFDKSYYNRGFLESNQNVGTDSPTLVTKEDNERTIIHIDTSTEGDDIVGGGSL